MSIWLPARFQLAGFVLAVMSDFSNFMNYEKVANIR